MNRGSLVVPAEFRLDDYFYLDVGPRWNEPNNTIRWNRGETGLVIDFELEDPIDEEMWVMVLIPTGTGYCYASELRVIHDETR